MKCPTCGLELAKEISQKFEKEKGNATNEHDKPKCPT
jgi:hypothetical protein